MSPSDRHDRTGFAPESAEVALQRQGYEGRQPNRGIHVWAVGAVGLAIGLMVVLRVLIPNGMDPTIFIALGEDSPALTRYAEELLGDPATRPLGHDGKFFFAQANDPWHLRPGENAVVLDRPIYRGQRMLFPMIAGGFGLFPPHVIVWAMLLTNLLFLAIGAMLAARLALHWGASPWLGLSVPLNIGLLYEIWIGGAGVVAYVLCLGALYALAIERGWTAAILLAAAALTREVMLAFAVGVFLLIWIDERRLRWRLVLAPITAIAVWHVYIRLRLMGISGLGANWSIFAPPFTGMFEAIPSWAEDPVDLLASLAILAVVIGSLVVGLRRRLSIAWGAFPFIGLAILLSVEVWREPSDLSRALAPVLTAAPFLVAVSRPHGDIERLRKGTPEPMG